MRLIPTTRVMDIVVIACIIVVAIIAVGAIGYASRVSHTRRFDLIAACERGNVMRRQLNVVAAHLDLNLEPLPIVPCSQTIR